MTDFSLLGVEPEHYPGMWIGGGSLDDNHPVNRAVAVSSERRRLSNNRLERNKRLLERLLRAQVRIAEAQAEIADPIYGAKMAAKRKRKQEKKIAAQKAADRKQQIFERREANRFNASTD